MKKYVGLMAVAIAMTLVSLSSRPASADFTLCSQYRETIYAALSWFKQTYSSCPHCGQADAGVQRL